MINFKIKLALFNLSSKLVFTALFLIFLPFIVERINLRQVDNDLINKREQVINLISKIGIEPFITSDSIRTFGSYNILKEEFINLERINLDEDWNFIEVTTRLIDDEEITFRVLNYSFKVNGEMYLLEIGKSLTSIHHAEKDIKKIILYFLAFIIIITLLTDLQYSRYLLRPFEKITHKLKGISNPSQFDKTPVKTTTYDFLKLDHALGELMGHINELFQKEKDITVNISHELLTPVSVIRSKLENLLLRKNVETEISVKIEESLKTLQRLQNLVNSLLFIARIESNQYVREESFFIKDVLQEIAGELSPIAEDKEVLIKEEFSIDPELKNANRSLIFSMFYNVINNAVKNTSAGGEIELKIFSLQNRSFVAISDNGKGMTETQLGTLFSRFKTKTDNNGTGTGIGLAIAKSIADFHKIDISVTSEPGKGTIFSFTFPEN